MLPKWHALVSIPVFFILLFVFKVDLFSSLLIALLSFLIDIDHYLFYIFDKKDLSLKRTYHYFYNLQKNFLEGKLKKEDRPRLLLIFHSLEFLALLFIFIILFNNYFLYLIFISFLFHFICDLIYGLIRRMFLLRTYSIILYITKK